MRALLAAFALMAGTAWAQTSDRVSGYGDFTLGDVLAETLVGEAAQTLSAPQRASSMGDAALEGRTPIAIAGALYHLRLSYLGDTLDVISLRSHTDASPGRCLDLLRAAIVELEEQYGALDGAPTGWEAPWPAPRTEVVGASLLRAYAFPQNGGATLHRYAASLQSGGALEVSGWAWDGGPDGAPIPAGMPGAAAPCRISIEFRTVISPPDTAR